uniref:EIF-4F 25 kDa subunit n=1 Tax=Steinernema glaseri TaxID=37863 RepID=A0A1I7Z2Z6_9BILA
MVDCQTSAKSTSFPQFEGSTKLDGANSENGNGSQTKLKSSLVDRSPVFSGHSSFQQLVECRPDEHKLEYPYVFSFFSKPKANFQPADYAHYVNHLTVIQSVEQFWSAYQHLQRPQELPEKTDYHVFKLGIEPVWEHPQNCNGGKWILRVRKGLASRIWENLLLAMIGEQFNVGDEICGAVCSVRNQEDIISIWNRSGNNNEHIARIRDVLRRVLNLPSNVLLEYKKHNDCLKDQSSYRHAKAV